ncbi:uncharacterized protein DSM5745_00962 [Aspergillus mulundensis]|uniref:Uncharacterized protein n=1 Tax=Aspergillus mulundensis TaxID=1810919 RepID=A0A3D8T521_9EURO|nr:hypothetical protein DSM5745_00962 [Aspergillus mulundensis]RDW93640.1 hypothetical protein DSM5745_00962 [Aspergillus mulundensis]
MEQINSQISKAIDELHTIRIVADIPTERLSPDNYLASATHILQPWLNQWQARAMTRFLAVSLFPRHSFAVIDINNHRYDFEQAHRQLFPVPVHILRLSRKTNSGNDKWSFFRRAPEDHRAAREIAIAHWHEGQNPTPLLLDHINRRVYLESHSRTDVEEVRELYGFKDVGTRMTGSASPPASVPEPMSQ